MFWSRLGLCILCLALMITIGINPAGYLLWFLATVVYANLGTLKEMEPMGSKGQVTGSDPRCDYTEIAYPENRYAIACIGCGVESHLQMIPHREQYGVLVGWVFVCEKCRPNIIGRRMWFGTPGQEEKIDTVIGAMVDPENQPHQFMGDAVLARKAMGL